MKIGETRKIGKGIVKYNGSRKYRMPYAVWLSFADYESGERPDTAVVSEAEVKRLLRRPNRQTLRGGLTA